MELIIRLLNADELDKKSLALVGAKAQDQTNQAPSSGKGQNAYEIYPQCLNCSGD